MVNVLRNILLLVLERLVKCFLNAAQLFPKQRRQPAQVVPAPVELRIWILGS
jgi:hypothetical protein